MIVRGPEIMVDGGIDVQSDDVTISGAATR